MIETCRSVASFRDPAGFIFRRGDDLFRQVNKSCEQDFTRLTDSGLYDELVGADLLVPHEEVTEEAWQSEIAFRVIKPERLPYISYPYEWSFSQLKDAALLTLELQRRAISRGMSLKDASAYNVQFRGGQPIFIDTLSFEVHHEGQPWAAYGQFCRHFLAPLALMAKVDIRLGELLRTNIDGIPLDLASRLLPVSARLHLGLLLHLILHAKLQSSHSDKQAAPPRKGFDRRSMLGMIESLESTVKGLVWKQPRTEWAGYTSDNTYTKNARKHKHEIVSEYLDQVAPESVWDLGANTGEYSRLASSRGIQTVSFDIDPACVERNYRAANEANDRNLLPLLADLTNPSPAAGWASSERQSFADRGPVDLVMALALVHHLAIVHNLPLSHIAEFFSQLCQSLIIEFVPKDDPQVVRLLRGRVDIFDHYTRQDFEAAFRERFRICRSATIVENGRILYLMERI